MKVSVCVPHYRQEEYLMAAVESVLSQTLSKDEVEVVICDNASGEKASPVLDKIEILGPQVKVLRNAYNIGMVANFNKAVRASSGDIICLLSADDMLLPGAVARICDEFRADDSLVMVYGGRKTLEGNVPAADRPLGPTQRYEPPTFAQFNLARPDTPLLSAFFRRQAYETVGGFKGEAGPVTDWLLWTEIGLVGAVLRIHEPLGVYRVHGGNETLSARKSYHWILYHYLAESYAGSLGVAVSQGQTGRRMSHAKRSALGTGMHSLRRGQRGLCRKQLLLTYGLWPSFRTLGEVLAGIVISLLPRSAIERLYLWFKSL